MSNLSKTGLSPETLSKIKNVFKSHARIEKVILYGSRAKGNFRNGSDIDLTLVGKSLTTSELFKIENELDDLLLPYKIDLSILHNIENPGLIKHINRIGLLFFSNSQNDLNK